jgi:hypothetical protein
VSALFEQSASGVRRWAQTFLPPQGGQLTTATVFIRPNPAAFSLTFEIRPVDDFGLPTNSILGTTTVSNLPETAGFDEPREVTATFSTPVPITLGRLHALVLSAASTNYGVLINAGDLCPDGKLFHDDAGTGAFVPLAGGSDDLVYAVTIV